MVGPGVADPVFCVGVQPQHIYGGQLAGQMFGPDRAVNDDCELVEQTSPIVTVEMLEVKAGAVGQDSRPNGSDRLRHRNWANKIQNPLK